MKLNSLSELFTQLGEDLSLSDVVSTALSMQYRNPELGLSLNDWK